VWVDNRVIAAIERGLFLLVGIAASDSERDVRAAVDKIVGLRVFTDSEGKMNRSVREVGGEILVVSQFTLMGEVRRGRRPSFTAAAAPEVAAPLIDRMVEAFRESGLPTRQGRFGARMQVESVNDGPVTLILEIENATVD